MTKLEKAEKWAVILAAITGTLGVVFGGWQLSELVDQTKHEKDSKSAELMLQLADRIEDKFSEMEDEIDDNNHSHPLVKTEDGKGGRFEAREVPHYLNQFEDVGILSHRKLLL